MRRALALALVTAFAAGAAHAKTWKQVFTMENGANINIDTDYVYKDRQSGRLVVMQALSKGSIGPSAPGKADSIGSVSAIDCVNRNMIAMASYRPNAPLDVKATWRTDTPKKATGADNEAILKEVCPMADKAPVK